MSETAAAPTPSEEIPKLVEQRHFSKQMLAWAFSDDPIDADRMPDYPMLIGALVESLDRLARLEDRLNTLTAPEYIDAVGIR